MKSYFEGEQTEREKEVARIIKRAKLVETAENVVGIPMLLILAVIWIMM